jgi:hypothetical protein
MVATSRQGHVAARSISGLPMETITKQNRITLKNLKVADFASEETLCFTATIVFDDTPIAEARNDGHGGSTFLRALNGKAALLAQAEAFAKGLPPTPLDLGQEGEDPHYIDMTLDFLVDELADAMHAERKVRAAFNRDIGNKVLFIKDGKLLFIKGIKLKAIADRAAYFASLRSRQAQPIVILAELPHRARHSTCGSSMSWATSPTDPAPPHPPDSPALDAGLFFSLRPSIGAGPDAVFQLTRRGPRTKLPACSLIRQHMPAARVPGCRGSLPRHPPVRIASISADARPRDADAFFQPRAGAAIP